MAPAPLAATTAPGSHLVLYDGVCGLCNRLVQFVLVHDRDGVFNFASLQSTLGRRMVTQSGADPDALTSLYVVSDYRSHNPRVLTRSDAALFVVSKLAWPYRGLRLFGVLPKTVLDHAYNMVARTRYRVFGRIDQCLLPRPEFQSRFVE